MSKKLFTIHRNCYATIDINVSAENEEEALRIANMRFDSIPAREYMFDENEVSIIDINSLDDLDALKEEFFLKFAASENYGEGDEIYFFNNVLVHLELHELDAVWNTYEEVERILAVSGVTTDGEDLVTLIIEDSDADDVDISELDDAEQIEILKAAIKELNK